MITLYEFYEEIDLKTWKLYVYLFLFVLLSSFSIFLSIFSLLFFFSFSFPLTPILPYLFLFLLSIFKHHNSYYLFSINGRIESYVTARWWYKNTGRNIFVNRLGISSDFLLSF